ncbi:MAG: lactonase family protein [Bacteroidota bacterium]
MKFLVLLFITLLGIACSTPGSKQLVFVGTYTGRGSDGIYAYRFNPANGDLKPIGLVAKTENPSFITIDPAGQFLYSVNETDSFQHKPGGAVSVFAINKGSGKLSLLQQISSLGAAPAHLSLDQSGRYLMVANYNGGNAAVFPVGRDGKLGQQTAFNQDAGSGPNANRQAGPHAHFIQATNDNRYVMIADLGIDKVLKFRFNADNGKLIPADSGFVNLNPGSGPRHLAFSPSGKFVYVLNELNSTITWFSFESEAGMMQKKQTISTLPASFMGENTAAEIAADAKGRFLYVSNRGDNSIGLFKINSEEGSLTPVEWVSTGGKTPRSFAIDPTGQWLFAANQDSDNIVLFRIDQASGQLSQTSQTVKLISPVCIKFMMHE